ncbi:MAG: hypothetical protein EGQ54_01035 [[Ruminococcus] lactaris]|nr:hypothetical protein [[Ruminococcus] lactaris]
MNQKAGKREVKKSNENQRKSTGKKTLGRDSLFRCFFHIVYNVKRQPVSEKSAGFPSAGSTAGKNQS